MAATMKQSAKERLVKSPSSHHLSPLLMLGSQLLSNSTLGTGLPSFVIKGLESEQIWQQLELRNEHKSSLTTCTRNAARIQAQANKKSKKTRKKKVDFDNVIEEENTEDAEKEVNSDASSNSEDEDGQMLESIRKRLAEDSDDDADEFPGLNLGSEEEDDENDENDFDFKLENEMVKGNEDEEEEDDDDDDEEDNKQKKVKSSKNKGRGNKRVTEVDDNFFKLADMEDFLEIEDKKEEKRNKPPKSKAADPDNDESSDEDDEDDEEIDMFGDMDEDKDESKNVKYSDFFDPPMGSLKGKKSKKVKKSSDEEDDDIEDEPMEDDDKNDEDDEDQDDNKENETSLFDDDDEASDDEEKEEGDKDRDTAASKKKVSLTNDLLQSDGEEEGDSETDGKGMKSTFELRQIQLQKKAREMEEQSLTPASWELKGEAKAAARPENSLLETVLDFQHTSKQTPVITDETTKTLEEYIKQRIKDKVYDSVERKAKPQEDAFEFKKRVVLDQEKSKLSLGQLYEAEFLKQQQQDDEEVKADPECEKIQGQINKLFLQLDALSNFRYTPMKPGTEVKIIVNTPAISMEEVAPVATADSEMLAPEEVYDKKKGELKGSDERTVTDKKRALRQKKKDKRIRKKDKETREKAVEKMNPGLGNKHSKAKAHRQLEEMSKSDRGLTMIKGDGPKVKSSSAFFSQLQDEVNTNSRAQKVTKSAKKQKLDPSRIML